ncbi:MAG: Hsp70 family protein, partial [Sphingomicrobium sp.]
VNVSAKDKGTGKEQQIRIQASGGLKDEDIDKMVKEAEQFAEEDKQRRAGAEAKNQAESLIHSTEKQLAEHGDKVSADVKSEIEAALAEAKSAVEGGDPDVMTEKTNALTQAVMKLGQAMYEQQQQAEAASAGDAGADADADATAQEQPADEEVVDAEFSEVDDEPKA